MANILVTGGAGFIGSHLVTALIDRGHKVRVLDNFCTSKRENLKHVQDKVEIHEADMCDPAACKRATTDIEIVFHEAALGSVPKSVDEPQPSHDTNINGTFNILRACVDNKVRRVIYAGSSSAYGDSDISPKHEGLVPSPLSPYAVQKLTGEYYLSAFHECFGLETLTLRYFNVFGERQDPNSRYAAAIPAFVIAILRGESPTIFGEGKHSRDFTYIDNVVHGNMLAMETKNAAGAAINIACGGQITVNQVIAAINAALGTDIKPNYVDPRPGDVLHSCADITLAKNILNFEPTVSFEAGLKQSIDYYKTLV